MVADCALDVMTGGRSESSGECSDDGAEVNSRIKKNKIVRKKIVKKTRTSRRTKAKKVAMRKAQRKKMIRKTRIARKMSEEVDSIMLTDV